MHQFFRYRFCICSSHRNDEVCSLGLVPEMHLRAAVRLVSSPCAGNKHVFLKNRQRLAFVFIAHCMAMQSACLFSWRVHTPLQPFGPQFCGSLQSRPA